MAGYEGELAGSILLEDGDAPHEETGGRPVYSGYSGMPSPMQPFFGAENEDRAGLSQSPGGSSRGMASRRQESEGDRARLPTRTPSPQYHWVNPKKVSIGEDPDLPSSFDGASGFQAAASGSGVSAQPASAGAGGSEANAFNPPMSQMLLNPYWAQLNSQAQLNAQAYYGMMMANPQMANNMMANQAAAAAAASGPGAISGALAASGLPGAGLGGQESAAAAAQADSKPTGPQGSAMEYMQMMMQMQQMQAMQAQSSTAMPGAAAMSAAGKGQSAPSKSTAPSMQTGAFPGSGGFGDSSTSEDPFSNALATTSRGGLGGAGAVTTLANSIPAEGSGKRTKNRAGGKGDAAAVVRAPPPEAAVPKERGGKGERRRRGERGALGLPGGDELEMPQRTGGKASKQGDMRPPSNPIIEQLKMSNRNLELHDLVQNIAEIAQDQYGSRLIQQKLEVANDEEKQKAFKAILAKMPQLTTDVFGNYVIQKFFEYGNAEQRRILAEQLVGQVLKLSHQMYGCRVVQKALDSVPIEQQVLLIGELRGHVIRCIEDQHGNHVIQKCIERLPTDKINFIVDSFDGQTCRMAKHCYGCRVIQRVIEYCSSQQISLLLDEVLRNLTDLATDQYGNYVVQHVMEHSSRPGDRANVLFIVRKNVNLLSCHKYASNVVEKALSCGTLEERAGVIQAIIGEGESHAPILNMMRDRFANYIVQRTIALAQSPQREALLWKLHEQMPTLKKSNTYGKHIITALEKAQIAHDRGL